MFFQECETFAEEYESLRAVINQIDDLIHSDNGSNLYNPKDVALILDESPAQIDNIFKNLSELGLLDQKVFLECQNCGNLISSEKIEESISNDILECTQCGDNILDQKFLEDTRYRLNPNKVLCAEIRSQESTQLIELPEPPIVTQMDFGIITALDTELDAVKSILDRHEQKKVGATTYYLGEINSSHRSFKVALAKTFKMGNVNAALTTQDLIYNFNPNYIIMIGIAGGLKRDNLELGDVVVADLVIDYEYLKILPESLSEPRIDAHQTDYSIVESAQHFDWAGSIDLPCPSGDPDKKSKLFIGPIASGNKVVTDEKFIEDIKSHNSKIIAIEMESEGVCTAASHLTIPKRVLIIRGISDMADADKDAVDWHPFSASAAAKFFLEFLKNNTEIF
jgi:nucleoside phosphorylase